MFRSASENRTAALPGGRADAIPRLAREHRRHLAMTQAATYRPETGFHDRRRAEVRHDGPYANICAGIRRSACRPTNATCLTTRRSRRLGPLKRSTNAMPRCSRMAGKLPCSARPALSTCFLPEVAPALHRYSPGLKLIVLLRDRVERAVSQYYMNKIRGDETAPLWWALLLEPLRIHRSSTREWQSNIRTCSYRRRGLYSVQLQNLYRYFPRSQIHVIRSLDLLKDHRAVLRQLFAFLGVAEDVDLPARIVSPTGPYNRERHRVLSWILRTTYLREHIRLKTLGI